MPQIIPIRDLKNTSKISEMCAQSSEPIFVTKNGYGDMVFMRMDVYEKTMLMQEVYTKLAESEADLHGGRVSDAHNTLKELRAKHGV